MEFEKEIYFKLLEAEKQAAETKERFTSEDILEAMKAAAENKQRTE